MSKESSEPNVAEPKPQEPRFIPNVNKRKFRNGRFYDRLRYLIRLPLANSITRGITGVCILIAANHIIAYVWKGPEHPLNRFRWNLMKEKGLLSPEMLEKERLLNAYFTDNITNPREPIKKANTMIH